LFKLKINTLKKVILVYFPLITIHVLVVYVIKNIGGFGINDPVYVVIKMWKEVVLAILIFLLIYNYRNNNISVNNLDLLIILFILIGIVYVIISPNITIGLWSFRSIYGVFAFYLLGRILPINFKDISNLLNVLIVMGLLTSIFGIIQVLVIGPEFFRDFYGEDEVAVAFTTYGYENIRASSTFITPHEFGLFLVLCFLFSSYLFKNKSLKKSSFIIINIILLVGLAFTLSRSSIVLLILCFGLYWVNNFKSTLVFIALCLCASIILYFIGVIDNFASVLEGRDPSSMGRFDVLDDFITHLKDNPLGSGLGTVGVVVRRFIPSAPQFEGEIFNIFAMLSLLGGTLYIILLFIPFLDNWRKSKEATHSSRNYYRMIAIIIIALTLRELILPRDFTNYALGWFLIGSSVSLYKKSNRKYLFGQNNIKIEKI